MALEPPLGCLRAEPIALAGMEESPNKLAPTLATHHSSRDSFYGVHLHSRCDTEKEFEGVKAKVLRDLDLTVRTIRKKNMAKDFFFFFLNEK